MASINQVIRFNLSDAGTTAALGLNLTNAEIADKLEAGPVGLAVRGSNGVNGICSDYSGNLYLTDQDKHAIYKINEGGEISLFAGLPNTSGDTYGVACLSARFNTPWGIGCDKSGNVYVADRGNNKVKVIRNGKVYNLAGSTSGHVNGVGPDAKFAAPKGLCVDKNGNVFITEGNYARKISPDGAAITIGSGFGAPLDIAVDNSGSVFVLDTSNNYIKKIDSNGTSYIHSGSGSDGRNLGTSPNYATECEYTYLTACTLDASGNLYVYDRNSSTGSRLIKVDDKGRPYVIAEFSATNLNDLVDVGSLCCTPAQKIFFAITNNAS